MVMVIIIINEEDENYDVGGVGGDTERVPDYHAGDDDGESEF